MLGQHLKNDLSLQSTKRRNILHRFIKSQIVNSLYTRYHFVFEESKTLSKHEVIASAALHLLGMHAIIKKIRFHKHHKFKLPQITIYILNLGLILIFYAQAA